ncbi:hypothetical protein B0T11DRAFT_279211 [Plectosphaerella cucumerina]|uniref:Cupin type-2 domain-containing protein n=1 Tax=Plectosphaerella cucumerina TaxID=40658 RepID=A0A8K0X2F0_9PEZI|nr:hypothetical protein B0T11DRAFT_279211 [Plectosphaerella cucumerina]
MSAPIRQSDPASDFSKPKVYITGHDSSSGKAIVQDSREGGWTVLDNGRLAMNVMYTTSEFPASLNSDEDIKTHDRLIASGTLGLVNKNGTVARMVEFAPGYECLMHRTTSIDYGVCLEGSIELVLDSGDVQVMHRSDVVVQRGTIHAWRNPSATEWARMFFVLQDCQEITLDGKALGEDLGVGVEGIPSSSNH